MLESQIKHTKEGYKEYIDTTSPFIILPKKKKWSDIYKIFQIAGLEEIDNLSGPEIWLVKTHYQLTI